jgi:TolA-binding protein
MAATMVKLEQHAEALRTLTALAADPKTVTDEVLYDLAWSQQATRDSASAQKTYRRLIEQYPSSRLVPAARVELAELLYQQEEFAAAAKVLERVVEDRSADPKTVSVAVYRLGSCYEKLNDPARAAAMFRSFLARKGDEELVAWAHYQAGVNFVRQEKFDEAMKHFQSALDSRPRAELAALATLKLGEAQAQAGQFEVSEKTFRGFLAKFEKDRFAYQAHFGLGWALENQRKYDDARRAYQQVIATHNGATAARAQFQVGETHFAEGQYEKAVAALLAVVDVYAYPEWSARALLEAGRAFEQLKQPEQAAAQYRMLVDKHGDRPEAELAAKRLKSMEKGQ